MVRVNTKAEFARAPEALCPEGGPAIVKQGGASQAARGRRLGQAAAKSPEADGMNARAGRSGETRPGPDAAGWHVADPEAGDPAVVCPRCWPLVASYCRALADATARARAAAGVGALLCVRSGAGMLMSGTWEGLVEAAVGRETAARDDGAWRNGRPAER